MCTTDGVRLLPQCVLHALQQFRFKDDGVGHPYRMCKIVGRPECRRGPFLMFYVDTPVDVPCVQMLFFKPWLYQEPPYGPVWLPLMGMWKIEPYPQFNPWPEFIERFPPQGHLGWCVWLETHRNCSSYLTCAADVVLLYACLQVWLPQLDVM